MARETRDYEIKTTLNDREYSAFKNFVEKNGFTERGAVRNLIINAILTHDDKLSRLEDIYSRAKTGTKQAQNGGEQCK